MPIDHDKIRDQLLSIKNAPCYKEVLGYIEEIFKKCNGSSNIVVIQVKRIRHKNDIESNNRSSITFIARRFNDLQNFGLVEKLHDGKYQFSFDKIQIFQNIFSDPLINASLHK